MIAVDTAKVEEIIRHVATTIVLPRWKNLQASDIREKNPGDLVTIADEESERAFSKLLPELLPGSLVVGEEAVSKDPAVLTKFNEEHPVWVIDPVDGTHNFSHGSEKFGILISLIHKGVTQYGWAFDAVGNRMVVAGKGKGATLNGKPLKVSSTATEFKDLAGRGSGSFSVKQLFKEIVYQRCSLHDYMDLITGKADFIVHKPRVTPWDHAATNLIAQEAGAYVAMNENEIPYDPVLYGPALLIVAPTQAIWRSLYAVFKPKAHKI